MKLLQTLLAEHRTDTDQQVSADHHNKQIQAFHVHLDHGDKFHAREYVKKWNWSNDEIAGELYKWFTKRGI